MISEFLHDFFATFPSSTVKPKAHFLVHYPCQIMEVGPPTDHDTVRFEGKHNYFKEVYNRSSNHITIVKTLAMRHQFYAYLVNKQPDLLKHEPSVTFAEEQVVNEMDQSVSLAVSQVTKNRSVVICKSAKHEGLLYAEGCVVVSSFSNDSFNFSCIRNVFYIGDLLYLICIKMETLGFNSHYNAFEVSSTAEYVVHSVTELFDHSPLGLYDTDTLADCWLVPLKYHVCPL